MTATREVPTRRTDARIHRAWWVALVTLGVLVAAAILLVPQPRPDRAPAATS